MKKVLLLIVPLLVWGIFSLANRQAVAVHSEHGTVPDLFEIYITCNADSFQLIRERFTEDIYISSTVEINGKRWENIPLRLRGDSSRGFPKKSLKLKFPKENPFIDGRWTLNLNGEYLDSTYMRQVLATRLFAAAGIPCFHTRHALVHINGDFHGIFLAVENIDKQFLNRWGISPNSDLYKATRDGACLNAAEDIQALWEKKANEKDSIWEPLARLITQLNFTPDAEYNTLIHRIFDYENLINSLALNMLIGNRSTYYHNYFVCRDPKDHRWRYVPWDLDNTFIVNDVDDPYQRGGLSDYGDALLASNPLFERALVTPEIFSDIQKRVGELHALYFNPRFLDPLIDSMMQVLSPYIPVDTFYKKHPPGYLLNEVRALRYFIITRPEILKKQFSESPTSFQLLRPEGPFRTQVTLKWRAAHDPNGDALRYNLVFSSSPKFPRDITTRYDGLADTVFTFPTLPPPGKYYWKVSATDGKYYIRGFDNVTLFEVRE
jgi:hypothetical protein